jgi:NAD(P)-dependent dehydrogenase (short-subunit alcohol dehydrogenase family)
MLATLEGKVALVTGVSRDGQVGQTAAKVLAENGAALAICARTQSNEEERAEELRQAGARVLAVAASLTDEAQVCQLIERVLRSTPGQSRRRPYLLQACSRAQPGRLESRIEQ